MHCDHLTNLVVVVTAVTNVGQTCMQQTSLGPHLIHFSADKMLNLNHLEERLLDQVQAQTPYTPPVGSLFAEHAPRHDIGCLVPCKIITLIDPLMNFSILNPPPPPVLGYHFLGGGFKSWCSVKPGLPNG